MLPLWAKCYLFLLTKHTFTAKEENPWNSWQKKTTGDGGSFKPVLLKNILLTVDVDMCQIVDKSG